MKYFRTPVLCLLLFALQWTARTQDKEKADSLSSVISSNAHDTSKAQKSYCGARLSTAQKQWLKQFQQSQNKQTRSPVDKYLPMQAHIVGRDDGSGYYQLSNLWSQVCDLNAAYSTTGIQFYLKFPLSYVDDTDMYEHADYSDAYSAINSSLVSNSVNVYFSESAGGACGYYTGGHDCVVMANGCAVVGGKTFQHELGHFFSLPHTFNGWESGNVPNNQEKVNGSNCTYAGDGFCDTPPDYASWRWSCPMQTPFTDPNGVSFVPDGTLYMSYANNECRNRFSNEQETAMYNNWLQQRPNLQPGNNVVADSLGAPGQVYPQDGQTVPYNHVTFSWNSVPGATAYHLAVTRFPSFANTTHDMVILDTSITIISNDPNNPSFVEDSHLPYKWKVKALSDGFYCDVYSETREFEVGAYQNTGITEVEGISWNVYPNPAQSGESISVLLDGLEEPLEMSLYDVRGQVIRQWTQTKAQHQLKTAGLSKGMYIMSMKKGDGLYRKSLMLL